MIDSIPGAEIKCKTNEPVFTMQHKFCLVDDKILMTGTLNWGNDRSFDHWNYVYITSKQQLVEPVKNEFYQMWNIASDIQSVFDIYCDSDAETVDIRNCDAISTSEESGDNHDSVTVDSPIEKMTPEKITHIPMNYSCVEAL